MPRTALRKHWHKHADDKAQVHIKMSLGTSFIDFMHYL